MGICSFCVCARAIKWIQFNYEFSSSMFDDEDEDGGGASTMNNIDNTENEETKNTT